MLRDHWLSSGRSPPCSLTSRLTHLTLRAKVLEGPALGLEAVAHPRLGDEMARSGRIILELVPECFDVLAQIVGLLHVRRSPDLLKQLSLAHKPPGMPDQRLEELPLGRCEMHLWRDTGLERFVDHVVAEVNGPSSQLDGFDELWFGRTPGHGSNSGQEFLHAERFCDVVIGTCIKGIHFGGTVHPSGKDDDGTCVHLRSERMTSTPSMSGRPRSRITRSG